MAQLANIVHCSHQCFNSSCHLTWRDVTTNQHELIVTFKCSKTIYCINCIFLCYVCQALLYGQFLGLPYSVCPVITVPLSSLKLVLLPNFIQRFLLLVSQMLRCFSVILFIMVQPLGPSITAYWVNSYRHRETGQVMHIRLIQNFMLNQSSPLPISFDLLFSLLLHSFTVKSCLFGVFHMVQSYWWFFNFLFVRLINFSVPKSKLCLICVRRCSWGIYPLWTSTYSKGLIVQHTPLASGSKNFMFHFTPVFTSSTHQRFCIVLFIFFPPTLQPWLILYDVINDREVYQAYLGLLFTSCSYS